jgi:4-diphosphocytidyl-2-C-methyl-D-erythritol kinase
MLAAFRRGDAPGVAVAVHSDFERSVFAWHPALERLETSLRGQGCLAAGMSGSGSTVYGIAEGREHARLVAAAAERWPDVRRAICCRTLVAARVNS